ncbi:MAG: hypothetical protein PVF04_02780 [Anaerolineae bacterium]|jgi:hypothetical protein
MVRTQETAVHWAARRLEALLSPPGLPPDRAPVAFLELILISRFRSEQGAPLLRDAELKRLRAPTYPLLGQDEVSFNPYRSIRAD